MGGACTRCRPAPWNKRVRSEAERRSRSKRKRVKKRGLAPWLGLDQRVDSSEGKLKKQTRTAETSLDGTASRNEGCGRIISRQLEGHLKRFGVSRMLFLRILKKAKLRAYRGEQSTSIRLRGRESTISKAEVECPSLRSASAASERLHKLSRHAASQSRGTVCSCVRGFEPLASSAESVVRSWSDPARALLQRAQTKPFCTNMLCSTVGQVQEKHVGTLCIDFAQISALLCTLGSRAWFNRNESCVRGFNRQQLLYSVLDLSLRTPKSLKLQLKQTGLSGRCSVTNASVISCVVKKHSVRTGDITKGKACA